jgi:glycosyltransferase involved in cell wall biosynthesis
MRILIASTLDSHQPFGPFTRPYYLGLYLAKRFKVHQVGLDCSVVHYAPSTSVRSRSLKAYIRTIRQTIADFSPDVIYAQETLPAIAALLATQRSPRPALVFDFHTLSAFENWRQFSATSNKLQQIKQVCKTYLAQGSLIWSQRPIIAASQDTIDLIPQWYATMPSKIWSVGNGVTEDLMQISVKPDTDPYQPMRPSKIVAVIAPKASGYDFPSNEMSVAMTLQIAQELIHHPGIHFVIIGRDADRHQAVPPNVTFTGFLPSRTAFLNHLAHADIGLLPFPKAAVAGGARNKALDYFACKKLVVSTPEGLRGLEEFHHQRHLLITPDTPQDMAKALSDACTHFEHYRPLTQAAYNLVQQKYSWQAKADDVAEILEKQMVFPASHVS